LTSLFFIGLVEARVDVLVMSAFNRNEHLAYNGMFGVIMGAHRQGQGESFDIPLED